MIEVTSFSSTNPGAHTLILGSIHGNEVCGSIAIDKIIEKIRSGAIQITSGQITFLPRANRDAYVKNVREIEHNLNRIFGPQEVISKEHQVAKLIEKYIQQANFVLDLHSIHEGEDAFAFLESSINPAKEFIIGVPVPHVLLDWENLYGTTSNIDTIAYATTQGIPGVTIECGNHTDPKSIEVAENVIDYTLSFFGHNQTSKRKVSEKKKKFIRAKEIIYRPSNAKFSQAWKNFDQVKMGETIGFSDNGIHTAPYDGVIIIPKPEGAIGDEWYYLGRIGDE